MAPTLTNLPTEVLLMIFNYHFSTFERPFDLSGLPLRRPPDGVSHKLRGVFEDEVSLPYFLNPLYDDASKHDVHSSSDRCEGLGWLSCTNQAQIHGKCWPCHGTRRTPLLYVCKSISQCARDALVTSTTFDISDSTSFLVLVSSVRAWGNASRLEKLHFSIRLMDRMHEFDRFLEVINPNALDNVFPKLRSVTIDYCPEYRRPVYGTGGAFPCWADAYARNHVLAVHDTLTGLFSSLNRLEKIRVIGLLSSRIEQWLEESLLTGAEHGDFPFQLYIHYGWVAFARRRFDLYRKST